MNDEGTVNRLVLKEGDILVVRIPEAYFTKRDIEVMQKQFRKKLYPRKNPILILPHTFEISVVAKEELKEVISYSDEWQLWEGEDDV